MPETETSGIPIVDLGEIGIGNIKEPSEEEWARVSEEIKAAFVDIGFVYFSNHGIPQELIDEIFSVSKEFFSLDDATKQKYVRGVHEIQGYSAPNQERLTTDQRVRELRESFDVQTLDGAFPDEEISALRPTVQRIVDACKALGRRLLTTMAIALGLDRSYFASRHEHVFSKHNLSALRLLNYPAPAPAPHLPDADVTRCGAHTDYGTFTFLFQDNTGGLEVKERGGTWVTAKPIPGTILVNVGDILQFWTADKFRATEHRVLLSCSPSEHNKRPRARQSIAFFVHPDESILVSPLDGSEKYETITSRSHSERRFTETYKY